LNQYVAFSVGEIVDVTFRDEFGPLEVDGSREMALQDAYRGGSNHGFDITFHPTNWLSAYMAFGSIKAYSTPSTTPSTIKPPVGSGDPSQIWLLSDVASGTPAAADDVYIGSTDQGVNVVQYDGTNKFLYVDGTVGAGIAVGSTIQDDGSSPSWTATVAGFVHTLERATSLPYFSAYGITEEDNGLEYAGGHVEAYSVSYTQGGLMQCSLTGQALTLNTSNAKTTGTQANDFSATEPSTYFVRNSMYVPCTAGRKVGAGVANIFRFESQDTSNRSVKIMLSTNQDADGSGSADGLGEDISGDPDSDPFANGADWVPYTYSIEMGFSNTFERGPINNDADADYFLKGDHENTLTLNVDLPNESASSGTAHRNSGTMRAMVKNSDGGRVNADIQFGLENGQALIVHYRNLKLFGLPRSFENSIRLALNFFVLEQPEMTVIDDLYDWVVYT